MIGNFFKEIFENVRLGLVCLFFFTIAMIIFYGAKYLYFSATLGLVTDTFKQICGL